MKYYTSTPSTAITATQAVSAADAALRHATAAASVGLIPHGVPVQVEVQTGPTSYRLVTVTPTGRSWGSLEAPIAQAVAA